MTPNALVEVEMYQFKAGDAVSQEDLEDWSWLGDSWEDHVDDLPKEEAKPESRTEIRSFDHNPPTFRVTSDCVGFRFHAVGEGFGNYSCGIEWLTQEDGPEGVFDGCREDFLKMANLNSEPEERHEGEDMGEFVVRRMKETKEDNRTTRIITAWHYWSSGGGMWDDFDCGVDLLGQVRLDQVPIQKV